MIRGIQRRRYTRRYPSKETSNDDTKKQERVVSAGAELHQFIKAHYAAACITGNRFLPIRHDGLDWQLRFSRVSSIDDSVEFILFRENGVAATRRVLTLCINGSYATNLSAFNESKAEVDETLTSDILTTLTSRPVLERSASRVSDERGP